MRQDQALGWIWSKYILHMYENVIIKLIHMDDEYMQI